MVKPILLQVHDDNLQGLADLVRPYHQEYCDRHDMQYLVIKNPPTNPERNIYWGRIPVMLDILKNTPDGTFLFYLDMDALVIRRAISLCSAFLMPKTVYGLVPCCTLPWEQTHYNSGAVYIRNHPSIRDFLKQVWEEGPTEQVPELGEEPRINALLKTTELEFEVLNSKWNAYTQSPHPKPVVRAWHGIPDRYILTQVGVEIKRVLSEEGIP